VSTLRGTAAVVGLGITPHHKRGTGGPAIKLALEAIVEAAEDAGIHPGDIDGFVSYGSERSEGQKLMPALGTKELRFAALAWSHGGGIPGALNIAASAIATGQAEIVVVYRSLSEFDGVRLQLDVAQGDTAAQFLVNGLDSPLQLCAINTTRLIEAEGVPAATQKTMAQVSYYHARNNPSAIGHATRLTDEKYESSRWISEPYRLFDSSRENDGSAAVILVSAERAKDFTEHPAYLLSAPLGTPAGWGPLEGNQDPLWSSGFTTVAKRLWAESGYTPHEVDVAQIYENTTGMGVGAIIDHGFCSHADAGDFITFENLTAPQGKLPINTSGGNLAEGFIHGMGLVVEAVQQIRGTSANQVPDTKLSLMTGGPGDAVVSSALLGTAETL
jgi:acetyl-CoA acetyltransferase